MSVKMLGKRIMLEGPDQGWHAGHGGDEYGNCSLYLRTPWFGIVFFVDLDYQDKVELPEPGEHPWVDAKYYNDVLPGRRRPEPGSPRR